MADRYSIKNVLGQEMMNGLLARGEQKIDLNTIAPGNYLISFYKEGAPAGNKMFVKK